MVNDCLRAAATASKQITSYQTATMLGASPFGFDQFSFKQLETEGASLRVSNREDLTPLRPYPLLIYEGSIDYWRTRDTIHLSVFEHQRISTDPPFATTSVCVEIVGFSPKLGVEAPHLYLSSDVLYEKFRRIAQVDPRLEQKNGQLVRKKNIVKCNEKFTIDAIRNYVLSRVGVIPTTSTSAQSSTNSIHSHDISLNIPRPELPISPTSASNISSGEVRTQHVFEIKFTPLPSDVDDGEVLLLRKPSCLGELPIVNKSRCVLFFSSPLLSSSVRSSFTSPSYSYQTMLCLIRFHESNLYSSSLLFSLLLYSSLFSFIFI